MNTNIIKSEITIKVNAHLSHPRLPGTGPSRHHCVVNSTTPILRRLERDKDKNFVNKTMSFPVVHLPLVDLAEKS